MDLLARNWKSSEAEGIWYWDPSNSIGLSGNYSLEQYYEYRNSIQIKWCTNVSSSYQVVRQINQVVPTTLKSPVRSLSPMLKQEPNVATLPDYKTMFSIYHFMDCLPSSKQRKKATRIRTSTITLRERAANVINSTTPGPKVAVELEPNVCVVKSKAT